MVKVSQPTVCHTLNRAPAVGIDAPGLLRLPGEKHLEFYRKVYAECKKGKTDQEMALKFKVSDATIRRARLGLSVFLGLPNLKKTFG